MSVERPQALPVLDYSSSGGGVSGIDYTAKLNAIITNVDELEAMLKILTNSGNKTLSGLKRLTNPVNVNISSFSTNIKQYTIYVEAGEAIISINGENTIIKAGYKLTAGNGFTEVDANVLLNGTCTILISWAV